MSEKLDKQKHFIMSKMMHANIYNILSFDLTFGFIDFILILNVISVSCFIIYKKIHILVAMPYHIRAP